MIRYADFFCKVNAEMEKVVNLNTNKSKSNIKIFINKIKRRKLAIFRVT